MFLHIHNLYCQAKGNFWNSSMPKHPCLHILTVYYSPLSLVHLLRKTHFYIGLHGYQRRCRLERHDFTALLFGHLLNENNIYSSFIHISKINLQLYEYVKKQGQWNCFKNYEIHEEYRSGSIVLLFVKNSREIYLFSNLGNEFLVAFGDTQACACLRSVTSSVGRHNMNS